MSHWTQRLSPGPCLGGLAAAAGELGRDLPRLVTPGGLRGAAVEAAWWTMHLAVYPWGLVQDEIEQSDRYHLGGLGPAQRGFLVRHVETAGTPILLVHGLIDNRGVFSVLRHRLRRRGFENLPTVNYSLMTNDVRGAARRLSAEIEAIVAVTGYEKVHVVAHSLGGLIARYYVQRLGGDERVHTLVTLGTPHSGSLHAYALPVQVCRQLRPGSELMRELELPAPGCRTRFVSYWSDTDQVIVPHVSARLDHPDLISHNVRIRNTGHLSLPRARRVAHEITQVLGRLDHEGHTIARGITHLRADTTA